METLRDDVVAVVDDDPSVLDSLRFLLEVVGYRVRIYLSAESYLDDISRDPACLILDHHMPRVSGLELVEQLRAAGKGVPVLLITGSPSTDLAARAARLGVQMLEKPLSETELLGFVQAHLC